MDIWSAEARARPEPVLAALRAEGPLGTLRAPFIGQIRLTTTYAGAQALLKDADRFRMRTAGARGSPVPWWAPRTIRLLADNMLTYDEPDHRRLRGLVDQAFQRSAVAERAEAIWEAARTLADGLDPAGFDVVEDFARILPLQVIARLLGLPPRDEARFSAWARPLASVSTSAIGLVLGFRGIGRLRAYVDAQMADARAGRLGGPGQLAPDGLAAALALTEVDGERLDREELTAMVMLLLLAGSETTTHLIAGGVWALTAHPDQRAAFETDPAAGIEEVLRWFSPVLISKPRLAAEAQDFFGAPLQAGERVSACLIAANHDPERFEEPDRFDPARRTAGHLAFGAGPHFCLGLQLARAEGAAGVSALFERHPDLISAEEPVWTGRNGVRAMRRWRVRAR